MLLPIDWCTITLDNVLDPDNGADSDGDTLTDWSEANVELLHWQTDGSIILPTIKEHLDTEALNRFVLEYGGSIPSSDMNIIIGTHILPAVSHPKNPDGDGDGYVDGSTDVLANGKVNDPRPLQSDVFSYSISDHSFVNVEDYYYCGYQGWIRKFAYDKKEIIASGGCAVAAACDVLLYLQKTNKDFSADIKAPNLNNITINDYVDCFYQIATDYIQPIDFSDFLYNVLANKYITDTAKRSIVASINVATKKKYTWGVLPLKYESGIAECSNNLSVIRIDLTPTSDHTISTLIRLKIIKSLNNNIPVTINYGLLGNYKFINCDDGTIAENSLTGGHYVTITEYIIDKVADTETLRIGTWSDDYYLDFNDFYNKCGIGGSVFFYEVI